jgi:hypothetical protein
MKNLILTSALFFSIISCNKNNTKENVSTTKSEINTKEKDITINSLVDNYLAMKDALAEGDGKKTAEMGKTMLANSEVLLNVSQNKDISDILGDIKENAEHVSESAKDVAHQREHFEILSKDFEDLIALKPYSKTLYKDFCPMANKGKGANWLSDKKEISNPYINSMKTCGEVKQVIAAK